MLFFCRKQYSVSWKSPEILSVLYKFPWNVELFKFVLSYLGHHWSLFRVCHGKRVCGKKKKLCFAWKQARMQTANFQFQYLLVIKTYFANFSNKVLKKEEEYNIATRQLYLWRLFVGLMELYCTVNYYLLQMSKPNPSSCFMSAILFQY